MNIVEGVKQLSLLSKHNKCLSSERMQLRIAMRFDKLFTISESGCGYGLALHYSHIIADDWELSEMTEKENALLDESIVAFSKKH